MLKQIFPQMWIFRHLSLYCDDWIQIPWKCLGARLMEKYHFFSIFAVFLRIFFRNHSIKYFLVELTITPDVLTDFASLQPLGRQIFKLLRQCLRSTMHFYFNVSSACSNDNEITIAANLMHTSASFPVNCHLKNRQKLVSIKLASSNMSI